MAGWQRCSDLSVSYKGSHPLAWIDCLHEQGEVPYLYLISIAEADVAAFHPHSSGHLGCLQGGQNACYGRRMQALYLMTHFSAGAGRDPQLVPPSLANHNCRFARRASVCG